MNIASEDELGKKNVDVTYMHMNTSMCPYLCVPLIKTLYNSMKVP